MLFRSPAVIQLLLLAFDLGAQSDELVLQPLLVPTHRQSIRLELLRLFGNRLLTLVKRIAPLAQASLHLPPRHSKKS